MPSRGSSPRRRRTSAPTWCPSGDPGEYVDLVTGPMLDAAREHARWIDVFCEQGAFDGDQARAILAAGAAAGLEGRLHANQLTYGPGVRLAAELGLAAVDHCTYLADEDVAALRDSGTIATLLPGVEFSTKQPYPDGRRLIDAGRAGRDRLRLQPRLVLHQQRALLHRPGRARDGADPGRGGPRRDVRRRAGALDRDDVGALTVGRRADFTLLDAPSHVHLAYRPGVPLVLGTWIGGRRCSEAGSRADVSHVTSRCPHRRRRTGRDRPPRSHRPRAGRQGGRRDGQAARRAPRPCVRRCLGGLPEAARARAASPCGGRRAQVGCPS